MYHIIGYSFIIKGSYTINFVTVTISRTANSKIVQNKNLLRVIIEGYILKNIIFVETFLFNLNSVQIINN